MKFSNNRKSIRKVNQHEQAGFSSVVPISLGSKHSIAIIILTILSALNVSLKSDEVSGNVWSLSVGSKVTPATIILLLLFWLPIIMPLIISQVPQVESSLNWLREQEVEEVETNLLRIKLKYNLQEASESYAEKISDSGAINLSPQETQKQLEFYYKNAIALVNAASDIDSPEAIERIDQLANYYDGIREKMPSGHNRTRLLREISSIMWTLIPKVINFPIRERLNSNQGGERLSAYKYIEWNVSIDYMDLLVSRAVGILEVPFAQYAALLTLRRVATSKQLDASQSAKIVDLLNWSANLDYMQQHTRKLILEIASILKAEI